MIKCKSVVFSMLLTGAGALLASGATALPKLPSPGRAPPPPSQAELEAKARQLFFGAVQVAGDADGKVRDAAARADEAGRVAAKRATDFASCPSPDAQALYDSVKQRRDAAEQSRQQARSMAAKADSANAECHRSFQPASVCDVLMSSYGWKRIEDAYTAEVAADNAALTALSSLECLTCNASGVSVVVPEVRISASVPSPLGPLPVPTPNMPIRGMKAPAPLISFGPPPKARICTAWDPGSFSANVDAGNGELSANVRARLPRCIAEEEIGCSGFDPVKLLPVLQRLRIVPPEVTPPSLTVSLATRSVRIVTGVSQPTCASPVRICTGATTSATFSLDPSRDALPQLRSVASCQQWAEVGCAAPAFDRTPTYSDVQVPDGKRVHLRWTGPGIKPGEIDIDVRGPDFDAACNARPSYPSPRVEIGTRRIAIPFVCRELGHRKLVARP